LRESSFPFLVDRDCSKKVLLRETHIIRRGARSRLRGGRREVKAKVEVRAGVGSKEYAVSREGERQEVEVEVKVKAEVEGKR
jgi:hypothetical protein